MKIFYLYISVFSLFLIGCSSTYKVSDFSSRYKFYDNFNESANDKTLKVILRNDSSFTAESGAQISNDSIIFFTQVQKEKKIDKNKIRDIQYTGNDFSNLSAVIFLKDGTEAIANKINVVSDSSIIIMVTERNYEHFQLNKVKQVSYKNHLLGMVYGFVFGAMTGFTTFFPIENSFKGTSYQENILQPAPVISALCLVVGSIWGGLNGYTYTYEFY